MLNNSTLARELLNYTSTLIYRGKNAKKTTFHSGSCIIYRSSVRASTQSKNLFRTNVRSQVDDIRFEHQLRFFRSQSYR